MTADIRAEATELIKRVDEMGGAVAAIEQGFQKAEIERSAYRVAQQVDAGERVVVGVNKFTTAADESYAPLRVDPVIEQQQSERLATLRRPRDAAGRRRSPAGTQGAAARAGNVASPLPPAPGPRAAGGRALRQPGAAWGPDQP